jgi:hypothetical protein
VRQERKAARFFNLASTTRDSPVTRRYQGYDFVAMKVNKDTGEARLLVGAGRIGVLVRRAPMAESRDHANCGGRLLPLGSPPSGGENKDRVGVGAHGCPPLRRTCARVVRAGTVSGPEVVGRRWVGLESAGCWWVGSEPTGGERELRLGRWARRVEGGSGGLQSEVLQDARD